MLQVECLPGCSDAEHPRLFEPMQASDYRAVDEARLKEQEQDLGEGGGGGGGDMLAKMLGAMSAPSSR